MVCYVEVILPYKFGSGTFTYKSDSCLQIGVRVRVTLRRKELIGVVRSVSEQKPRYRVLPILEVIDENPIMLPSQLDMVSFASEYYADPIGNVFKSILPPKIRDDGFSGVTLVAYRLVINDFVSVLNILEKKKPAQYRLLLNFAEKETEILSRKELLKNGAGEHALKLLVKNNILEKTEIPFSQYKPVIRNVSDGQMATEGIDVKFSMTNSMIVSFISKLSESCVSNGKYVLALMPVPNEKMLLTLGFNEDDVVSYFPSESSSKRSNTYLRLLNSPESVRLILGGRTSVFLPLTALGHIVVIDEHDERYKGCRSPLFNSRDMAVMLAKKHSVPLTFISSSPSLETMRSVMAKSYGFENYDSGYPVKVLEKGAQLLSLYSRKRMTEILAQGKKVLVFQNRRGYGGFVECSNCGNVPGCPRCNARLGFHASLRVLKCHYCGYMKPFDGKCDICGYDIVTVQGYGTERMASVLSSFFPNNSISILDSDQSSGFDGNADIIVGTSYMIRHELDFADIGLVLVANADNLLYSTDFRATEKAFRTVMTLRSIARENKAEYIIQTRDFLQPVFRCMENGEFINFYKSELIERKEMNFPPFSRLLRFEFRHMDNKLLHEKVGEFHSKLTSEIADCHMSPVFDPDVDRIDMEYITQIVVRLPKTGNGIAIKRKILDILENSLSLCMSKIKISIEVDPQ